MQMGLVTSPKGNKKSFEQAVAQIKVVAVNFIELYFHFRRCRQLSMQVQVNIILTAKSVGNNIYEEHVIVDCRGLVRTVFQ